jgi:hypothetical protein
MEHSCAVSQGTLNVFAIFLVDKRKLLVPNFNGATVERRLNTGMTDSSEDLLFEKNVNLLNMGGPVCTENSSSGVVVMKSAQDAK